ncbi:MAG: hypothetical protein R6X10_14740 [Desulfobacterales bacterium]
MSCLCDGQCMVYRNFISYDMESDVKEKFLFISETSLSLKVKEMIDMVKTEAIIELNRRRKYEVMKI